MSQPAIAWVIPGKLAVGELPTATKLRSLAAAGIQAILSVCGASEGSLPAEAAQQFRCCHHLLPDSSYSYPLAPIDLAAAIEIVHRSLQSQQPIYVHCLAGIQRSPTVCIAYLCRYDGQELWDALEWVKTVRPQAAPTKAQLQTIEQFIESI